MAYQPRSPSSLPGLRVRNQRTHALMRRDVIWQIAVPLGAAVLVVLGLMVWLILTWVLDSPVGAAAASVWADISLIFLVLPTALFGLIALALLAGLIYGLGYLLRELPFFFKTVQDWVALATYRVGGVAEKLANLVVAPRSFWAGVSRAAKDVQTAIVVRRIR